MLNTISRTRVYFLCKAWIILLHTISRTRVYFFCKVYIILIHTVLRSSVFLLQSVKNFTPPDFLVTCISFAKCKYMCFFLPQLTAPSLEMKYSSKGHNDASVATMIWSKYPNKSFHSMMRLNSDQSWAWRGGCSQSSPQETSSLTKGRQPPESKLCSRFFSTVFF